MKSCPWLQGLHRIYVQVRPERRLHLSIGGHAYLLPNTSLVIKCPVKHFPKSYIRWFKDGRPLASSERLGVSRSGSLKVHFLGPEDTGLYKCVAGPASEIFTLQVLGGPTGRGSADGRESFPLISGSLRPSREELMMAGCPTGRRTWAPGRRGGPPSSVGDRTTRLAPPPPPPPPPPSRRTSASAWASRRSSPTERAC